MRLHLLDWKQIFHFEDVLHNNHHLTMAANKLHKVFTYQLLYSASIVLCMFYFYLSAPGFLELLLMLPLLVFSTHQDLLNVLIVPGSTLPPRSINLKVYTSYTINIYMNVLCSSILYQLCYKFNSLF